MSATSKETESGNESEIPKCHRITYESFGGEEEEEEYDDDEEGSESDSDSLFGVKELKEGLETIKEEDCESSVFSIDIRNWKGDVVHVCVGNHNHGDNSSFQALSWTLNHWVTSFTTIRLLHVFPVVRFIPSPIGRLPRSRVNLCYIDHHLDQQKCKRKLLLQKFIDLCAASQVKVETMLIEGDNVAQAIGDVVNNIGIRKLVLGISKSNLSKSGSRRRKGIADQVVKKAPENCDVKIICEGKVVIYDVIGAASPRSTDSDTPRSSQ